MDFLNSSSAPRKALTAIAALLIVAVSGGGFYYMGFRQGSAHPETIVVKGITNIGDDDATADFSLFWEAFDLLKNEHLYGDEVSDQDYVYGAIHGLTDALDDPNTVFLPPDDSKKFSEDISGNFGGIGAEIGLNENDELIVVAPLKDSPAEAAGLKSKDLILRIDDTPTSGISVDAAVKQIRGEVGTEVLLNVLGEDGGAPRNVPIVRNIITVPTLETEFLEGNIMHLKLFSFNESAFIGFYEAAFQALASGARGIVLDLRGNPGGYLDVAINFTGWFVDRGEVVVSERFRDGEDRVFRASGNEALKHIPVVVLVNGGSASASEILAGALRDIRGVKLVGTRTFGKGTVQELEPLRGGSTLKVTIANWVLPSGTIIEKNGLEPDIEVQFTGDDAATGNDPQLDRALEVLRAEIE